MVFGRIRDALGGAPKLEGEAHLPDYFPVEPKGCEKHAANLFNCLANEATDKAREMEKAGVHRSYYPDVTPKPADERAAEKVKEAAEAEVAAKQAEAAGSGGGKSGAEGTDPTLRLPTADDNPLDECRTFIAYYKRCCDRELKKKKNWILTEPYRVQEEYRYNGAGKGGAGAAAKS